MSPSASPRPHGRPGSPACSWRSTRPCDDARQRGLKQLGPTHQRTFAGRYDTLVADGLAANPEPASGRKRNYGERRSFNLATAFATHRKAILRYMYDLDVAFTNYVDVRVMPMSA